MKVKYIKKNTFFLRYTVCLCEPEGSKETTNGTELFQLGSEIEAARESIVSSLQMAESLLNEADPIYEVGHIIYVVQYHNHSCAHFLQ